MSRLLNFGEIIAMNAYLSPHTVGARDLSRSLTFRGWNSRSCQLANAFLGLGLEKGDRIAVLAYNCLEWMEIYAAVAKAGLVLVPINFRLVGTEIHYIVENSEAKAIIVQNDLARPHGNTPSRASDRRGQGTSISAAQPQPGIDPMRT